MKHNQYTLWAALLMPFLAACQQEETTQTVATDPDAVVIDAGLTALQTRLAYDESGKTEWETGDRVAVSGGETGETVIYSFDGATWNPEGESYLKWADGDNSFRAWRPVDDASYDSFDFPEYQNTLERLKAADWMTAEADNLARPDDRRLKLKFAHRGAMVTIHITDFGDQYPNGSEVLDGASLGFIKARGDNSLATGWIFPLQWGSDNLSFTAILPAEKYSSESTFFEIKFATGGYQDVAPPADLITNGLQAGKHYKYNLKLGKDEVKLTSVSVEEWTEEGLPDGMAPEVTYPKTEPGTNTIYTKEAGTLTAEHITEAIGDGKDLRISGPMNEADWLTLRDWVGEHYEEYQDAGINLDLGNVTELTSLPSPGNYSQINETNNFTGVSTLVLPKGLTNMKDHVFRFNKTLTAVKWPESPITIGYAVFQGTGLKEVIVPPQVSKVATGLFSACESLTKVEWKSSADISHNTFQNCSSLETVLITGAVSEVFQSVFDGCSSLESVTLTLTTPPTVSGVAFGSSYSYAKVYVPAEAVEAYKEKGWPNVEPDPLEGQH